MAATTQDAQMNMQQLQQHFTQYLQQHGADEQAYTLYRTQLRPALQTLPAAQALSRVVALELSLPPTENKLCAAMRIDEGIFDMEEEHLAHALNALKDACAISAKLRDADGMVEGSLALAKCFYLMGDSTSAMRSAQICLRAIDTHFGGKHALRAQAKNYLDGKFEAPKEAQVVRPKEDLPPSFIASETMDPALSQPSFAAPYVPVQEQAQAPAEEVILEEPVQEEIPVQIAEEPAEAVADETEEFAEVPLQEEELFMQEETFEEPVEEVVEQIVEETVEAPAAQPAPDFHPAPFKPLLQLDAAQGNLYLEDAALTVGFSKKNERITGSRQRRRDVQTSLLVGAQNGLLAQGTTSDDAMQQQISLWLDQGRYDEAFEFLSKLVQSLPEDSAYHQQVSIWTAQFLAASGDDARAIGLYARLVGQVLQSKEPVSEENIALMQELCGLYHRAEELDRERSLRRLIFRTVAKQNAAEDVVLDAGEEYFQTILESGDAAELTAMCRWYAAQKGDPQLFAEGLDALLPLLDAQGADEAVCSICRLAAGYCQKQDWPMQENWISAHLLAALNMGDNDTFLQLAQDHADVLAKDSMEIVRQAIAQCMAEFEKAEDYDLAAEFCSMQLSLYIARNETEQEEAAALKLADLLDACGRNIEAEDIRRMYLPQEEVVVEIEEEVAEEPEQEPAQEAEAPVEEEEIRDMDALRLMAEQAEADGDASRALQLRETIYQLRLEALGEEHPDTLAALNNYAKALAAAGHMKEAVLHLLSAVNGYAAAMGRDHAYTLTAMHNLARTMERAGQFTEALAVRETILNILSEKLPADHKDVQLARKRMLRARKLVTKV